MGQQSITPLSRHFFVLLGMVLLLAARPCHSQTQATTLPLILPSAIAYDAAGNLYIAERGNHVIRKVDPAGLITTIAGTGTQGFSGDNGPATAARLDSPQGLVLDANNILYIADTHNNRVRKLDLATGLITTIAGTTAGFSGDSGPATSAQLNLPTALALDANHNLYVADTQNHRIRKITAATGLIATVAGNGIQGFSGDNSAATSASIDSPAGLAVDAAGNLYLSDTHNHRIRKIAAASGLITTIAGATPGFSGDSGPATAATLALPHGLSIDSAGNIYIADTANHRIRRIDAITGSITTIAGNGFQTFSGDNGLALAASLDSPRAATITPSGLVTVADTANQRVRQLDAQPAPDIHTIAGHSSTPVDTLTLTAPSTVVYGTGQLTASFTSSTATGPITFTLLDPTTAVGTTLGSAPLAASTASFDTSGLAVGSYTLLASYAGDSTHASAQSVPLSLRVTPRPLLVTPSSITLLYGQPIPTLTGTISGLLPQDSTGSLTASFAAPVTTLPPAAAYQISASITGSSAKNYTLTIIPATLTIAPAPTLTSLTASATSITSGNPLALATHIASTTAGTPTGSVTLMDGATPLLSLASSAGSATFTTTALSPGLHTLTTLYAGDKNFIQSVSTPALITVIPAPTTSQDFTLTPTGATSQAISSGGTANFSFNLQIQDSTLASPITLAATGLPALATASFNPAYLPPGATPGTFTLTIKTPQTTALQRNSVVTSPLLTLLLFPIAGVAFRLRSYNRTTKRVAFLILASILTFCSGCGSRINAGDPSTNPVKTYIITVTGTATGPTGNILQRSTTVKLLIQSGT